MGNRPIRVYNLHVLLLCYNNIIDSLFFSLCPSLLIHTYNSKKCNNFSSNSVTSIDGV